MSSKQPIKLSKITKAGADDEKLPKQQMEYMGKVADGIMIFPYGMHANIPAEVLALMFAVGGDPDNRAAIGFMDPGKSRPTLADGEVAFYHPGTDAFIIWRATGDLEIKTGTGGTKDINITAGAINITADVNITGDTAFTGLVTANGKDISDTHGHAQANDSGGNSEAAISGVT